ncbi:MAG: MinD/ParA family protein [Bacteroidota bacterium]
MSDQAQRLREMMMSGDSPCRTLAITSGKGGVGKTNLTINLALALSRRQKRVVMIDADLGLANVDVMMGISPSHTLVEVIRGTKSLEEVLLPINDHLQIVPGGSGVTELADLDQEALERFTSQLGLLEQKADVILVDTGAGISRTVLNFVLASQEVLVVTTPEPTSITDAYSIIKAIDKKPNKPTVRLVINMAESEQAARDVANKLIMIVERFLETKVEYLGFIERDGNVSRSILQQQPLLEAYPYSIASRRINLLANLLLVKEAPTPSGSFFRRLAGFFRQAIEG